MERYGKQTGKALDGGHLGAVVQFARMTAANGDVSHALAIIMRLLIREPGTPSRAEIRVRAACGLAHGASQLASKLCTALRACRVPRGARRAHRHPCQQGQHQQTRRADPAVCAIPGLFGQPGQGRWRYVQGGAGRRAATNRGGTCPMPRRSVR